MSRLRQRLAALARHARSLHRGARGGTWRLAAYMEHKPLKSEPKFERPVRPIFIVGAPRSATSIMTWVLGQHPNIQPMPETSWIASLGTGAFLSYAIGSERGRFSHLSNVEFPFEPFMRRIGEAVDAIVHDAFEERCRIFYGDYVARGEIRINPNNPTKHLQIRRAVDDPKRRWVDGTPLNSQFLWPLMQLFPDAQYIHNLRRPHEVAASLEGFEAVGAQAQELTTGLQTWITHTENAWYGERVLGAEKIFRLDFPRIAREPEPLLRDLLGFLGEDFHPDCLIPFGERINSSKVDDKREAALERMRKLEIFQTAEALYNEITSRPVGAGGDEQALAILKQRFLDHCHDRRLV